MFEIGGVDHQLAQSAIELAGSKLPIRSKFKIRRNLE
jgi:large subunit ribosomal protein L16